VEANKLFQLNIYESNMDFAYGRQPITSFEFEILDDDTTKALSSDLVTRSGISLSEVDVVLSDGTNSTSYKSGADGSTSGALAVGSSSTVSASLSYLSSTKAISSQDALDALKLSVGLSTSAGTKTAFDFISADFNQDGKVSSQDALSILKYSVGLTTPEQAKWVFVDTANIRHGRQTKDKLAAQRHAAKVGRRVRGELKRIEHRRTYAGLMPDD
jgi:hypothetical protein